MRRNIVTIDESLCNGCGLCISGCHEGALQLIDGKARIVSDLYCDGLGACIGECPLGAISMEERDAEPYDETAVMRRISPKGEKTILAHLRHLKDHGETEYMKQGVAYIKKHGLSVDLSGFSQHEQPKMACGCPGSMARSFDPQPQAMHLATESYSRESQLSHWPVQLHLLNPEAGYFIGSDVVLAADCTAYAYPDFHTKFLVGRKLAIACPKLDSNRESYIEKLSQMIDRSRINTLTVVIMEVPCCSGLIHIAKTATERSTRKIPIKQIIIGVKGNITSEEWI